MDQIIAYRLTDGSVVVDRDDAIRKQSKINISEKVEELLLKHFSYYDLDMESLRDTMVSCRLEFINALLDVADTIETIESGSGEIIIKITNE